VSLPLPESYRAWRLHGQGFDALRLDTLPLRPPRANEALFRVDALSICYSDIKIIHTAATHPRMAGRDLKKDPLVLGHEIALTCVAVGGGWMGDLRSPEGRSRETAPQPAIPRAETAPQQTEGLKIGGRYCVQADIRANGERLTLGYQLPGGLAEYLYLDERALEGDEGCYVFPVTDALSDAGAALAEPWACVERAYADDLSAAAATAEAVPLESNWETRLETLPHGAALALIGNHPDDRWATLDAGAIHYKHHRLFGGGDSLDGIAEAHARVEPQPGGRLLLLGGGGPMGQMHLHRALARPQTPAELHVVDLSEARLDHLAATYGGLADAAGCALHGHAVDAARLAPEWSDSFDDVIALTLEPATLDEAIRVARPDGVVHLFAGVPLGTPVRVPLRKLAAGLTILGTSGSGIADQRRALEAFEGGRVHPDRVVAAECGLEHAADALRAVEARRYPGKVLVLPHRPAVELHPSSA